MCFERELVTLKVSLNDGRSISSQVVKKLREFTEISPIFYTLSAIFKIIRKFV